jgi:hypothetical protein
MDDIWKILTFFPIGLFIGGLNSLVLMLSFVFGKTHSFIISLVGYILFLSLHVSKFSNNPPLLIGAMTGISIGYWYWYNGLQKLENKDKKEKPNHLEKYENILPVKNTSPVYSERNKNLENIKNIHSKKLKLTVSVKIKSELKPGTVSKLLNCIKEDFIIQNVSWMKDTEIYGDSTLLEWSEKNKNINTRVLFSESKNQNIENTLSHGCNLLISFGNTSNNSMIEKRAKDREIPILRVEEDHMDSINYEHIRKVIQYL